MCKVCDKYFKERMKAEMDSPSNPLRIACKILAKDKKALRQLAKIYKLEQKAK